MKNLMKLFIAVCLIGFTSFSFAQSYGVKGGVNLANVSKNDKAFDENKMRVGFHVGGFAEFGLSDMISIRPELLYSQKGSSLKNNYPILGDVESTQKFDYLEVPVLLSIHVAEPLSIQAGPYLGLLLGYNHDVKTDLTGNLPTIFKKEDFSSLDYGLGVGATFHMNALEIGARYNLGLAKIGKDKTEAGAEFNTFDSKNNIIQVSVGFRFGE